MVKAKIKIKGMKDELTFEEARELYEELGEILRIPKVEEHHHHYPNKNWQPVTPNTPVAITGATWGYNDPNHTADITSASDGPQTVNIGGFPAGVKFNSGYFEVK